MSRSTVALVFIAKCSKCKVKCQLQRCQICEEAKCEQCADQHLKEAQEKWDIVETNLVTIQTQRSNRIITVLFL